MWNQFKFNNKKNKKTISRDYFKSCQCNIGYGWPCSQCFLHVHNNEREFQQKAGGFNMLLNFKLHERTIITEDHSMSLWLNPTIMFQLVDVFVDVTLLYYNPDFSQKHYFALSYSNLPGRRTQNEVYKTYLHSIYVLLPGRCEGASKRALLNKSY